MKWTVSIGSSIITCKNDHKSYRTLHFNKSSWIIDVGIKLAVCVMRIVFVYCEPSIGRTVSHELNRYLGTNYGPNTAETYYALNSRNDITNIACYRGLLTRSVKNISIITAHLKPS